MQPKSNANAVTHNPVNGVERPGAGTNEGLTPAIGDGQARRLLEAPPKDTLKGKRDRAILATLLFQGLRRAELCALAVGDMHRREGVMHFRVQGKGRRGKKIRYIAVAPIVQRLIEEYLDAAGHGERAGAVRVGKVEVGAGRDQVGDDGGMAGAAVAEDDGLDQRGPAQIVDMVERRGMFPSPKYRQCTSDLKRGPIEKEIRRILNVRHQVLIVNCMGLRAEESSARAKQQAFKRNARNSKAGREWYDWLPIHDMLVDEVWSTIKAAGQEPHWAYGAGMTRLSCCFCIMASRQDLKTAARLNPTLFQRYVETERRLDQTMMMPVKGERKFLTDIVC